MRVAAVIIVLFVNTVTIAWQDAAVIDPVKRMSVAVLDPTLPREPFEEWLRRLAGAMAGSIAWEINDCGEQTGDPAVDRDRDLPICVEARATIRTVRNVDATVAVQIAVGTVQTGIRGAPRVRWIFIEEGATAWEVPKLAGLPSAIIALREGPSPYYRPNLTAAVAACCGGLRLPDARDLRAPWSLDHPNHAIEGDFDGDGDIDTAVLLIDSGVVARPTLAVFHHADGRYQLAYRQTLDRIDDVTIERPQEVVLRLIRRGEEWSPEGGDMPTAYPHAFDAIALSTHKIAATGGVEARQHLFHWDGRRYVMY